MAATKRKPRLGIKLPPRKPAVVVPTPSPPAIPPLELQRPQAVIDLCRLHGLPDDTPYHPKYTALGVPPNFTEQRLEWACFAMDWPAEFGGLGAYGHLKNLIRMTWPEVEFNEWLEMALKSLTDTEYEIRTGGVRMRFVNWVGAGAAGKTFAAGLFACAWFMCDLALGKKPRSSVSLTSTSKGIIAQRVWPVIQKLFHEAKMHPDGNKLIWGRMIDSMKIVEPLPGQGATKPEPTNQKIRDSKHVICALAVETGDLQESLNKIKGLHTERMLVIVDEANSTPQAIFECIPNKLTAAREIIVLVIGNAGSRLDPHGLCCEPRKGWKSISIRDTQWETKGVPKWGIGPGVCVHFDAEQSPNVLAGKTIHKHIYSFERWQQVLRMGEEYRNTLQHWSQDRGFWPPDGISTTVFSEAMVISHNGTGKFTWLSIPKPCASLDPAFGGDNCVLQFGLMADIVGGRKGLQLTEHMLVPFNPDSPDAIDHQIAVYVIEQCKKRNVDPTMFGLDATGIGRGVASHINQLWSPRIQTVEFGGSASEKPASVDDPRASHEVYANRVTELWYVSRDMLVSDQLKGLYPDAITEFCSRTYEFQSRRYKVEPKDKMKLRLGYSPDHADVVSVLVEVARRNGMVAQPYTGVSRQRRSEEAQAEQQMDALYESSYSAPSEFSQYAQVDY